MCQSIIAPTQTPKQMAATFALANVRGIEKKSSGIAVANHDLDSGADGALTSIQLFHAGWLLTPLVVNTC
jgi:hypothetical protein